MKTEPSASPFRGHDWKGRALSIADTAGQLSIGRSMVYKLIAAGKLRTIKIGQRHLVLTASIDELIEARGCSVSRDPNKPVTLHEIMQEDLEHEAQARIR